jgi:hypothetical protein
MKYKIYSLYELNTARFVNTISIHLKVLQAIASSLFSAKLDLVKTSLTRPIPIHYVLEGDFLQSPYVQEDSIRGNIVKELR